MGINLAEHFNMTEEELEKSMEDFVKELLISQNKKVESMYEQRETLLPKLVQHMKNHGSVDGEDILYFPEKYSFSSEEFHALFELATSYLEDKCQFAIDPECGFENKTFFMKVEDVVVEFFIMWGQGTCTIMKLSDEEDLEDIPETAIGSLEGYKAYIEEEYLGLRKEDNEAK